MKLFRVVVSGWNAALEAVRIHPPTQRGPTSLRLHQVAWDCVQLSFEVLQCWRSHSSGQPDLKAAFLVGSVVQRMEETPKTG